MRTASEVWSIVRVRRGQLRYRSVVNLRPLKPKLFNLPPLNLLRHRPSSLYVKSLTLKLEEPEYEVLREFAHRQRKTHQEVMREALLRYLKQEGAQ